MPRFFCLSVGPLAVFRGEIQLIMDLFHHNGKWILLDIKGKMKKGLGVGEARPCDPLVIR